jgi:hypothetical protein
VHIQTKLTEVSLVCGVDACRVASRVYPDGDAPIRMLAFDVAPEIKVCRPLVMSNLN